MDTNKLKQDFKKREEKQKKARHLHDVHAKQRAEKAFANGWIAQHGFKTYHDLSDRDWQRLKKDFGKYEKDFQAQHAQNLNDKYNRKTEQNAKQKMSPYKGKDNRYNRAAEDKKRFKHDRAVSHDPKRREDAKENQEAQGIKSYLKARHSMKQLRAQAAAGNPKAKMQLRLRHEATIKTGLLHPGVRNTAHALNKHIFHTNLRQLDAKSLSQKYPKSSGKKGFAAFFSAIFEGVGIMNRKAMDDPLLDAFSPLGFKRLAKLHRENQRARRWQQDINQHNEDNQDNEQAKINARARALNRARMANDEDELQD